jgi:hypothetical protein
MSLVMYHEFFSRILNWSHISHIYETTYTGEELADPAFRAKLLVAARRMTLYLLDNLAATAQVPEEEFFEGRFKFLPLRAAVAMPPYEANAPLNPDLVAARS